MVCRAPAPSEKARMQNDMNALTLTATWDPKPAYALAADERDSGRASDASAVWKCPQFDLGSRPIPHLEADEVLIKVKVCGVCGSDAHCYQTDDNGYVLFSGPARFPVILGHEFSGEIVKAGPRVRGLDVGDAVAVESVQWCGVCTACRSGNPNQCQRVELVGFSSPGAFAEYIAVNERYCWSLNSLRRGPGNDQHVYELGSLIEPIGCAYNGIFVTGGGFQPGAYVAIHGAGPIGLGAVMMARAAGAAKIFVFDISEPRNNLAMELGADHAANPIQLKREGTSPSRIIREMTGGHGADVQIEAAGAAAETIPEIEKSFAPNGKMIYLGRANNLAQLNFNNLVTHGNQVYGSRGHAGHGVFPNIIRLLAAGRIPAHRMITSRFPLDRVVEAIEQSTRRNEGKIAICFP